MSCSTVYKSISAIKAIPEADMTWTYPFNSLAAQNRYLSSTDFSIASGKGINLLFDLTDVSLEVSSKRNRPGVLYTNTLKFSITNPDEEEFTTVESQLRSLSKACNLLITYNGGAQAIVRLCDPKVGYRFKQEDKGEKISCEISIANLTGLQRIK